MRAGPARGQPRPVLDGASTNSGAGAPGAVRRCLCGQETPER
ncbi:hypothetical protein KPATCC21470_8473 [Kitasatospora purpeofusca]